MTVRDDAVMTPARAARALGISPQGVADHIKRGNLDTVTVGGVRFVTAASLARLDKRRKAVEELAGIDRRLERIKNAKARPAATEKGGA